MGHDNDLEKYSLKRYTYMHIIAKSHTKFSSRGLQAVLSHRANTAVPDAKVISETYQCRGWKLKLQKSKFENAFLLKHEER